MREEEVTYREGNGALLAGEYELEPELLLCGPSGTGKSSACCLRLVHLAQSYPKLRALIVRKTRESLTETGLKTLADVMPPNVATWWGDKQWRFRNGSRISAVGMNEPTRIMSADYDVIYVQESTELEENDWEMLGTRLRAGILPFPQLYGDCNPSAERHWLRLRAKNGRLRIIESRHEDNPALFTAEGRKTELGRQYMARLDDLTGVRYKRLRKGIWCSAEGMVYEEEWEWHRHTCDPFRPPAEWRRFWVIDFGYTNPFVWQAWAQEPESGLLVRFAELYHTKLLVEECAAKVKAWMLETGEDFPAAIVCDHDAEDRATWTKHLGVPTVAALKSVSLGIQAVKTRLQHDGLVLMRSVGLERDPELADAKLPTSTDEEVESYVWKDGKKDSEPEKKDDHGMDAMRYLVMHVDGAATWTAEDIARLGRRWRGEESTNGVTYARSQEVLRAQLGRVVLPPPESEAERYEREVAAQQQAELARMRGSR